ncbi:acyltransferase family protein [Ramlibacter sp. PS4R-6]|uniref:acyltransferase family protein n=1 Tax=Ramlibacter sp. PS4R-6 TaxID=3133438 RepID=UPI00309E3E9E
MTANTTARLHALDNLRALMMWLGIVLHVAAIHMVRDAPLPWQDGKRAVVADLAVAFIHAFRMPVFFILAGFFVAMLLQSRGPAGMARHRALRLGLPFAVFWVPVFAATVVLGMLAMHRAIRGTWGLDMRIADEIVRGPDMPPLPRGPNTMHMWFLWMLLWMSVATALLARYVPPAVWRIPALVLRCLAAAWWGPVVLALALLATDAVHPRGMLFPSGSFIPPFTEWAHWAAFFCVGLAMYAVRDELFAIYLKRWPAFAVAGLVTFFVAGYCVERKVAPQFAYAYGLTAWLWSFAAIGIALKWLPSRSAVLAYLADASYWVYLVHLPLTILFGMGLYLLDLPALVKIALNIAATTAVCLASYQLFVRHTWVSVLLNGKRHERAPRPPAALTPA